MATVITVVPRAIPVTLTTAADEIVSYVEKMSGAKLGRGNAPPGGTRILLEVAPAAVHEEDAFRIVTAPGAIRLIGGGEAGVLYAAYALLEDLGVRWLVPGDEGEVVPSRRNVAYSQTDRTETPRFRCRFFYVGSPDALRWAVRNRLNGFFNQPFALAHGNGYYLPPMVDSIRSFARILPPEQYFAAHPEYYALLNGKRVPCSEDRNQLCTSNPQVIEILAQSIRRYFQTTPGARVFSIAPNDGYGWCQCDRCAALDAKLCRSKKWWYSPDQPVVSDRLCVFGNEVARRAVHDMPGRELYMFAYVSYCEPPETARPDPHLTPVICHYIPACYAHPINTPGCPDNEIYDRYLRGWAKIAAQAMVYAYTDKSQWLGLPRPAVRPMAADIRHYRALGFRKYLAQSATTDWPLAGPLYYVTARLLWNPDRDLESIIREWNEGMYGRAAAEMMAWYDAIEQVVVHSGGHYGGDPFREAVNVYAPGCFDAASAHLAKACELAENERVRSRIRKVQLQFELGVLGVDAICDSDRWERFGDRAAGEKARHAAARLLAHKELWGGGDSMNPYHEFLAETVRAGDVRWQGWGPPEQKGGRTCRNADETGPGDNAGGWASFSVVLDDLTKDYRVTMEIWGESEFAGLLVCTKGRGAGTGQGGVWKAIPMHGKLSGKPEWCTVTFTAPATMLDRATHRQVFGFGGGDQQAWVSDIRVEPVR